MPTTLMNHPAWESLQLNRYPPPQPLALTERMSSLYKAKADQILVTRGSDEGIDLLMRVFCRPGKDAIVECPPCFGMYKIAAQIQGAGIIAVSRDEKSNLKIDIDRLCQVVAERKEVRLVFITTPNNPTGDGISLADLRRILLACGDHALLVLDEAYIEFCALPSAIDLLEQWPNLVVLRTLSKAWGAAGLRCGTVIANPVVIKLLQRVMAPYPLSIPAIDAAIAITSPDVHQAQQDMLADIARCKRDLLNFLATCPWVEKVWPGEANFVLLRVVDAVTLVNFCAEQGVRIRDFSSQRMLEGCVRVTIGSAEEMTTLKKVLTGYGVRS